MHDLTTPEGVTAHMGKSTSKDDWNKRLEEVRKANGGYPDFWYETVIHLALPTRPSALVVPISRSPPCSRSLKLHVRHMSHALRQRRGAFLIF